MVPQELFLLNRTYSLCFFNTVCAQLCRWHGELSKVCTNIAQLLSTHVHKVSASRDFYVNNNQISQIYANMVTRTRQTRQWVLWLVGCTFLGSSPKTGSFHRFQSVESSRGATGQRFPRRRVLIAGPAATMLFTTTHQKQQSEWFINAREAAVAC